MANENPKKPTKIILKKTTNKGDNGDGMGQNPESGWSVLSYVLVVLIIFAVLSSIYSYIPAKIKAYQQFLCRKSHKI